MAVKNHNFRFNEEKEAERKAWKILHSEEVKENFRSQNEFVIAAINDYYARHLALKGDPYLESREKEDAFVKGIIEAVEQKVLDNLPGLAGMYMMHQQSLLSVLGLQGMVPVQQQVPMPQMVAGMQMSGRHQHPYKSRIKGKRLWLAEMDVKKEITLRRMRKSTR